MRARVVFTTACCSAASSLDLYHILTHSQLSQAGLWGTILPPLDLPEQFMHSSGQPQSTAATLQHYFLQLLGPFEEVYLRKGGRDAQRMQAARPQQGFPMSAPVQGRSGSMSGMPGTFPPVGTLPAVNGNSNSARVGQQMGGAGSLQVPDMPAQGMNNLPFANGQPQLPMRNGAQQMPNGLGGGSLDGAPFNMRRPDANSISATPSLSDLNGAAPVDADTDGRKRKMEDGEEPNGKRARQKTGKSFSWLLSANGRLYPRSRVQGSPMHETYVANCTKPCLMLMLYPGHTGSYAHNTAAVATQNRVRPARPRN